MATPEYHDCEDCLGTGGYRGSCESCGGTGGIPANEAARDAEREQYALTMERAYARAMRSLDDDGPMDEDDI